MSLVKRAADFIYTVRFLTLLVTKFEDTEAFKAGIIDASGNKIKPFDMSISANKTAYQTYYTPFHRLVFNIKKIIGSIPGGSSTIASYAAALYLIKEHYHVSDANIARGLRSIGIDPTPDTTINEWFVVEGGRLTPGRYRLNTAKMITPTFDEMAIPKDYVRVDTNVYPVGKLFGVNVYEVTHVKTGAPVFVTVEDLRA